MSDSFIEGWCCINTSDKIQYTWNTDQDINYSLFRVPCILYFEIFMSKTEKQEIGIWGEEQASLFLIQQGYEIIERNYGYKKGEIDIIGWTKDKDEKTGELRSVLSFVEVKTRSFGHDSAERAVGFEKAKKIKQTAIRFCFEKNINPDDTWIKFELVCVYFELGFKNVEFIKYIIPSRLFDSSQKH